MNRPASTRAPYSKAAYGQSPPTPASPRTSMVSFHQDSYPASPGSIRDRSSYPPSPSGLQSRQEPITVEGVQERLYRETSPKEDFIFPSALSPAAGVTPVAGLQHHKPHSSGNVSPRHSPTSSANLRDSASQKQGMQTSLRERERDAQQRDLSSSLFAQMLAVQSSVDDIRLVLDERETSLKVFIQQEMKIQRQSLSSEVLGHSQESYEEIRRLLQTREISLDQLQGVPAMRAAGVPVATQVPADSDSGEFRSTQGVLPQRQTSPPQGMTSAKRPAPEVASSQEVAASRKQQVARDLLGEIPSKSMTTHTTKAEWEDFQECVEEFDPHCLYNSVMDKKIAQRSLWHALAEKLGLERFLDFQMPDTCAARMTESSHFTSLQSVLIFLNTGLMAYESDQQVKAAVQNPPGVIPDWLSTANLVFNVIFAVELVFRILALRSWFWVAPSDWGWNVLDVILVLTSLLSDLLSGVNMSFIRTFRILRAIRVARIIRVLKFFRQLRQMLFSILACLSSLAWAFVFLFMIMFMFTILFLQGMVGALADAPYGDANTEDMRDLTRRWFGSVFISMESLLAAVTGGQDWVTVRTPLDYAGQIYSIAFVVYMLFVTVGVMNVLTGVFLSSADEFVDMSLIVQNEQLRVDQFCEQMLELFKELDIHHTGTVDWPTFSQALSNDTIRAYLSSLQLEPTHIRLIFDLLDEKNQGLIHVKDFVIGMVRLKGEAKAIDARIIQRELRMLPQIMDSFLAKKVKADIRADRADEYSV